MRATYDGLVKQDATFDTSFWVNAFRSGLLPYVLERFLLHYPPEVAAEMDPSFDSGIEFWQRVATGELTEITPAELRVREFGAGERAVLSLAMEHPDWMVLLDDRRPHGEASRVGLQVLSTPMFAVTLFRDDVLNAEQTFAVLIQLAMTNTVSPHLLHAAQAQLGNWLRDRGR